MVVKRPTMAAFGSCFINSGRKKPVSVRLSPKNTVLENGDCAMAGTAASATARAMAERIGRETRDMWNSWCEGNGGAYAAARC
ncbi:hypothetical protein D3C81_1976700 [compost metagenome]